MMNFEVLLSLKMWDVCNTYCGAGLEIPGLCFLPSFTGEALQK